MTQMQSPTYKKKKKIVRPFVCRFVSQHGSPRVQLG